MDDIWAYPYRLGIGLFFVVGTIVFMGAFIGTSLWLEKAFKEDNTKK